MSEQHYNLVTILERIAPGQLGDLADAVVAIEALMDARVKALVKRSALAPACCGCLQPTVDGICPRCDG